MEAFVINLQIEVQAKLDKVDPNVGPVKGYDKKIEPVEWAIIEMKHYLVKHPFPDKATEINYFKHWMPFFYKQHVYFTSLYQLELIRRTSDKEELFGYLEDEKKKITSFLK